MISKELFCKTIADIQEQDRKMLGNVKGANF